MYGRIKGRESASCAECRDLKRAVLEIASSYRNHGFGGTLEAAALFLFTFLRYPSMPPHNNAAELEIRDTVVLHRNVRHQLASALGREVFSVLILVARRRRRIGQGSRLGHIQAA